MYFLKVEQPGINFLRSRKSWRDGTPKDEGEGEGKGKGKGKQPLPAIPEDDDDDDDDDQLVYDDDDDVSAYSGDPGPSLKKSKTRQEKTGGKLLNKKVRIHKAKSISQKTISGEKKKKITKVIKNKELWGRPPPTRLSRCGRP